VSSAPITLLTKRRKFIILLCASATSALIMLDTNIVAVSLPSIARDLHAGFAGVQWIISAYLLTFAALLLPAGSLADLHGRRRVVIAGVFVFLIASAACGLATSIAGLEIARAFQGIGGSMLLTAALAIISSTFTPAERPSAFAFWGTAIGLAITSGPIAGGLITGVFGWRWAFLINVPLCIVFAIAIRAYVPESRDPAARRLDWAGVATLGGGLFALIWALIDGNTLGWSSGAIATRLGAAAAGIAAFIIVESKQARPMLDVSIFRSRRFLGAACGTFGYGAAAQVMIFFLPVYLQGALGLSVLDAGFAMLPFAVPLFLAPRLAAAAFAGRTNRTVLIVALAITAAGNLALATVVAFGGDFPLFAAAMLLAGIGTGILNPETAKTMQLQIPPERAGMASGIGATLRFVSLLLGVAALGAVMAHFAPAVTTGHHPAAATAFAAAALLAAGIALVALSGVALLMNARDGRERDSSAAAVTIPAAD
jgi:EmrB/QacA subfamily drug resistance transporter